MEADIARDYVRSIDLSRVDKADRAYIRGVILEVLTFHTPMPKLDVDPFPMTSGHYVLTFRGWSSGVDDAQWYHRFLSPKRSSALSRVTGTRTIPADDSGSMQKIVLVGGEDDETEPVRRSGLQLESGLRLADNVVLDKADERDRSYVRAIVTELLSFQDKMPKIDVDVHPTPDHYNVTLRGWSAEINDRDWFHAFLDERNRSSALGRILSTSTEPGQGENSFKLVKIARSTFSKSKRIK